MDLQKKLKLLIQAQQQEEAASSEEIKRLISHLMEIEDMKWRSRAKRNWYMMKDQNTKFFHACAT